MRLSVCPWWRSRDRIGYAPDEALGDLLTEKDRIGFAIEEDHDGGPWCTLDNRVRIGDVIAVSVKGGRF